MRCLNWACCFSANARRLALNFKRPFMVVKDCNLIILEYVLNKNGIDLYKIGKVLSASMSIPSSEVIRAEAKKNIDTMFENYGAGTLALCMESAFQIAFDNASYAKIYFRHAEDLISALMLTVSDKEWETLFELRDSCHLLVIALESM